MLRRWGRRGGVGEIRVAGEGKGKGKGEEETGVTMMVKMQWRVANWWKRERIVETGEERE